MKNKYFLFSTFFIASIFFDQIIKYLVRLKGGFYFCNPGIAWGIKLPPLLFWLFWIFIFILIFFLLYRELLKKSKPNVLLLIALALILGGTFGNLIDRIIFGCVIDFIDLKIWPVFNLADSFITIGAIIILIKHKA